MKVKLTQRNFDNLMEGLNHRMSKIENNVKWMSRIGYYMATLLTAIVIKSVFIN